MYLKGKKMREFSAGIVFLVMPCLACAQLVPGSRCADPKVIESVKDQVTAITAGVVPYESAELHGTYTVSTDEVSSVCRTTYTMVMAYAGNLPITHDIQLRYIVEGVAGAYRVSVDRF